MTTDGYPYRLRDIYHLLKVENESQAKLKLNDAVREALQTYQRSSRSPDTMPLLR